MFKTFWLTLHSICYLTGLTASTYWHLDNRTVASFDEILEDPFLVIRTKTGTHQDSMNWIESWKNWAMLESKIDFPTNESFDFPPFSVQEKGILEVSGQICFDHLKPVFTIQFKGTALPHSLWWQVSADSNFQTVISNLNNQISYTNTLSLTDLEETFLNPDQTYYIRACADCASWSRPFAFQVLKPANVKEISLDKVKDHVYKLSWESQESSSTSYLIFASNALDFVPSLYVNEQLNAVNETLFLEKEIVDNFICETNETALLINGDYAYYRIITSNHGQLSNPSPLIYIYGSELKRLRTHLKQDASNPLSFKRQALPLTYHQDDLNFFSLFAEKADAYVYHSFVPSSLWQELEPYFLPVNHPIKARLDRLFQKQRVTQSRETMEEAGFEKPKERKPTQIVIGRHPQFKDHIFKVFLDTQPDLLEWENWIKRIEGARAIQACIKRHGFRYFAVPCKWIYPLPKDPSPPSDPRYHRKNFILIADNMQILDSKENLKAFKNKMSSSMLKELYTILSEEGLIDSVYPDNIPFTKKGHMAFIDTEHYHLAPVRYYKLTPFLSADMQKYWQSLTEKK